MPILFLRPCPECGGKVDIYKGNTEERSSMGITINVRLQKFVGCQNSFDGPLESRCRAMVFDPYGTDDIVRAWNVYSENLEQLLDEVRVRRDPVTGNYLCPICNLQHGLKRRAAACHYEELEKLRGGA